MHEVASQSLRKSKILYKHKFHYMNINATLS